MVSEPHWMFALMCIWMAFIGLTGLFKKIEVKRETGDTFGEPEGKNWIQI